MYGYIVPKKATLKMSDFVLYRSYYCGICCTTGKKYGQLPRFTTNYDFAFLSALLHDYAKSEVIIEEHTCVLNPIKKKAVVQPNALMEKLVDANIMLCYHKAKDGIEDKDGVKYKALRKVLKKPYGKAKSANPQLHKLIDRFSVEQNKTEKAKIASIDRAADPFASMLRDLPQTLLDKTDDNIKVLCYNIGKFVYLIDALDDLAEDFKHKRYNPFLQVYNDFTTRGEFIKAHNEQIEQYLTTCRNRAEQAIGAMRLTQCYSLISNIVCDGMSDKIDEILHSVKKLKPPRI